jgi:tetratricopeptide (TPR) repeat protein
MRSACAVLMMVSIVLTGCAGSSQSSSSKQAKNAEDRTSDPLYSLTLMRQGSILLQQEQYAEALIQFERADVIAPGNPTTHNMIGLCHLKLGDLDRALESFNSTLDLAPSFTDARNNRGVTYLTLGQFRLAEVDFLAVLGDSTYPHRWEVYYNLGLTYLQRDQLGAAEENFKKALAAPQPVFDAYMKLSVIAQERGSFEEAIQHLEDARIRYPERTEAALRLGSLLIDLDRADEARPYLREVIEKQPGSDRARQAAALLDST